MSIARPRALSPSLLLLYGANGREPLRARAAASGVDGGRGGGP